MFERVFRAGWGDMDFNSHMRNTAYLDKSADLRMMYFAENGFPMAEFLRLRMGPVILRDELDYYREIGLLDEIRVTLELAELSADGSRASWCKTRFTVWMENFPRAYAARSGGWI
jgi:acyl-CoA thioester hydrolase